MKRSLAVAHAPGCAVSLNGRHECSCGGYDYDVDLDEREDDDLGRCDQCLCVSACLLSGLCPMCYELSGGIHD